MGLSPSTLFHFTSKKGLLGILKENFKIKYCLEEISHAEKPVKIAIPMVSFCDIKISEITEHIEKYGYYGIGLSKDWAIQNGLNPAVYVNTESSFCNDLISVARKLFSDKKIDQTERVKQANILRYIKTYEGSLTRKGKTIQKYRFADEREWRYVPNYDSSFLAWLGLEQYSTPEQKKLRNEELKNEKLTFTANDILYIIVKEEKEIDEIIRHIRNVKGMNYSLNEIERLTTRILSCERIINDF
jgi:hypothetical protein